MKEQFFTNRDGNTLIKEFQGLFANNPTIKYLDAVVGFLRASGYFALRPFLENIQKVRILIGIDVDKYMADSYNKGQLFRGAQEQVKQDYLQQLKADIQSSEYTQEVEQGILQMLEDVSNGKLEIRAHPSKKIHAKIYILYPDKYGQFSLSGAAITGSSNLTGNGLGISVEKQYEFNVCLTDFTDVKFAKTEFETLWAEAEGCPITAADIEKESLAPTYLSHDATPYEIYLKLLIEFFGDRIKATQELGYIELPEGYDRYEYQMDAVVEGYQKLLKYDGFFLADVVGLGKTVVAAMIAKQFCRDNGPEHTKILVVYPPAVAYNWKHTFYDFGIDKYTRFVSRNQLEKILDPTDPDYWNAQEYDLILVDEAHTFRTATNTTFRELQKICKKPRSGKGNIPGKKKKVMLISATPMNNTPADIYNEMQLFQDARCCSIEGVSNLSLFFSPLIEEFKKRQKDPNYQLQRFEQLAEKVRSHIIKPITVRRTRTDIESIERYRKDVQHFPKVSAPEKEIYEMNDRIADMFEWSMDTLVNRLFYARYQAIKYLREEKRAGVYDNAELASKNLANIRKNGLVKRLESSFYAFKISIERFRDVNQYMIDMFEKNRIFIAPDLDINQLYDQGLEDDAIEEKLQEKAQKNVQNKVFKADDFEPEFIQKLRSDQQVLNELCARWNTVDVAGTDDSKFTKFQDLLQHELFRKDRNPGQKLVVFSESKDTVQYLARRINRSDVLAVWSANREEQFPIIQENFDANCRKANHKDDFKIIITTDTLAEGVNLHRANVIVNYDTPWNSTKLMQRIGRVNRIGSKSNHIYNYVFFPSRQGNRIIRLEQIALSKIQTFHFTFGEDNQIYSSEEIIQRNPDRLFTESIRQQEEDKNKEIPFYEELRAFHTANPDEYSRIAHMSVRSRTGRRTHTLNGVTLANDTLVFVKDNQRKMFFRAGDHSVEEVPAVEALHYFKADSQEPSVPRIAQHYEHVQKTLRKFKELVECQPKTIYEEPVASSRRGTTVAEIIGFFRQFLPQIEASQSAQVVQQVRGLLYLVERGTLTEIPVRLKQMRTQFKRGQLYQQDFFAQLFAMAKEYEDYYVQEETISQEIIPEGDACVILSESFQGEK